MEYCLQVPANRCARGWSRLPLGLALLLDETLPTRPPVPSSFRIGHVSNGGPFSAPILKVIQECISLTAFGLFSVRGGPLTDTTTQRACRDNALSIEPIPLNQTTQTYVLREKLRWTDGAGFVLILVGVAVAMAGREMADRAAGGGAAAGGFPPPSVPGYQALTPDEGLDDHEGPGGVEMTDVRAATPPQGGGR